MEYAIFIGIEKYLKPYSLVSIVYVLGKNYENLNFWQHKHHIHFKKSMLENHCW